MGRDFFFPGYVLSALNEHTRWNFYFGGFRGRRDDGSDGLGSGNGGNLGAKLFFDFVEVDFTDGARDRLGIRRHVAALLEPSEE